MQETLNKITSTTYFFNVAFNNTLSSFYKVFFYHITMYFNYEFVLSIFIFSKNIIFNYLPMFIHLATLVNVYGPGWSEETDWQHSAWGHQQQTLYPGALGPEFIPGLPSNVSVTLGNPAVLPCRVANFRGRSVSKTNV